MTKKFIRKKRILKKIHGTLQKPRLSVFRSNQHIYAQIIDDINHNTILAVSTLSKDIEITKNLNCETCNKVGNLLAIRAIKKEIQTIVFDKNHYIYHGRVKALAEGARENGLNF
jgi:large subunit ribosomal protein L18